MDPRLFDAAKTGNLESLYSLLEEDPFILDDFSGDDTPLHIAALTGKTDFAKEMIRMRPGFAKRLSRNGYYPIHMASANGYVEIVKEILTQVGASQCFHRDIKGRSPLDCAVMKGRINIVQELIAACSNSDQCHPQEVAFLTKTALTFALKYNQREAMKIMITQTHFDRGELCDLLNNLKSINDTEIYEYEGKKYELWRDEMMLLDASIMGNLKTLNELLTKDPLILEKVSLCCFSTTPLELAALLGQTDFAKEIIKRRPEFVNDSYVASGISPLHLASVSGSVGVVKELLNQVGSSLCFLKDREEGRTALHFAVTEGRIGVINELLSASWESGREVTDKSETVLHLAVKYKQFKALKILVQKHIEDELLNTNDWDDNTVLHLAKVYVRMVKALLSQQVGSSLCILINDKKEGRRDHHHHFAVIKSTCKNIVHDLLNAYPEYIRKVTAHNQIVIDLSVDENSLITLKVLLNSHMAREIFEAKDEDGNTVFDLLAMRRNKVMENEFEEVFPIWNNEIYNDDGSSDKEIRVEDTIDDNDEELFEGANNDYGDLHEYVEEDNIGEPLLDKSLHDGIDGSNSIMDDAFSIQVGDTFTSAKECRAAIINASILAHRVVKFTKSAKKRIVAKCSKERCKWRIYARTEKNSDIVMVKTLFDNHTCQRSNISANTLATPTWVCSRIIDKVKQDPNFQLEEIKTFIKSQYGIDVEYMTAWRAHEKALNTIHGSWSKSYKKLPDYVNSISQSNPGNVAILETAEDKTFHCLFISYKACLNGFLKGCAPLMFIERTPIKQGFNGFILAAIGVDGNNDMFPIAFAFVNIDSKSMWEWFFGQLKHHVVLLPRYNWMTIISNPQYALTEATNNYFPEASHGHCTRHLAQIMQNKFGKKIVDFYFWPIAKALTSEEYDQALERLKYKNKTAADWIEENHPQNWAASKFQGDMYRYITSNVGEKFNKWIRPVRHLPIYPMLEKLHMKLMELFHERREIAFNSLGCFTEHAEKFIEEASKASKSYYVYQSGEFIYEVRDNNNLAGYQIDLLNKICTCLGWQKVGIPCSHAHVAIEKSPAKRPYLEYCYSYYTTQNYQATYEDVIEPVFSPENCMGFAITEDDILPPIKRSRKRTSPPKFKKKRSEATKEKRIMRCSICRLSGHTKKTCGSN